MSIIGVIKCKIVCFVEAQYMYTSSLGLIPSFVRRTVSVVDVVEMLLGVLLEYCLTMSF